ncbi:MULTISPECIES: RNA-binding S4 domain-containing protein [Rhodobacterales]|jgi:ribosome-associated heat shock protein Hsp15|uniref:RNA-binding S4 domain-containing protein n=1 Tax=Phaeobacter gallaeciensis TaxID=60890 RepID=A0A1B0ZVR4_9RHOB|nr:MULTISPECIES: RNA-binding S4 domain-containing protein [Phaeobacter]MDF1771678.1 RNA-binding S4 domain-containing protein [Pseudophaeobacter sp. bin_em_oilr2.035]MEE2633559.1 RNA-binding S4 domain-containing protein [Pseudomonadota bacterium]ANP38303.1 tRNA synthetase RNA-binding protein [Phaeobacter gallaeciensis]MDE4061395.1 RNA-binding S4 domain-containing protein [Phaeobacter gallaeciensis]MDE4097759.1 RNA-binding S4 domain-containing protein [Phaeobacter gallaeciensis]
MQEGAAKIRIDKWLWHARFFKTRSLAAKQVSAGHVRLNADKISKPAQNVTPGDVLTFPQGRQIRVVRVEAIGERRGPAPEAQTLYFDMTEKQESVPANPRFEGKGRPDKKSRRALDLTRRGDIH